MWLQSRRQGTAKNVKTLSVKTWSMAGERMRVMSEQQTPPCPICGSECRWDAAHEFCECVGCEYFFHITDGAFIEEVEDE